MRIARGQRRVSFRLLLDVPTRLAKSASAQTCPKWKVRGRERKALLFEPANPSHPHTQTQMFSGSLVLSVLQCVVSPPLYTGSTSHKSTQRSSPRPLDSGPVSGRANNKREGSCRNTCDTHHHREQRLVHASNTTACEAPNDDCWGLKGETAAPFHTHTQCEPVPCN